MKKGLIAIIAVVAIVVLIIISGVGTYNGLVTKREAVDKARSDIQTYLQSRADKIPNLVSTVKGYAAHEEKVLTEVTNARAAVNNAGSFDEQMAANDQLDAALTRLLAVVENYPDLKADTHFTTLMDELSGMENRIAVARKDYNGAVQTYNTAIAKFPASIIAGMFGFQRCNEYFEATDTAQSVPVVEF